MKNVMVRAWEIAKEAVAKFGGKVKEYFAQALTMAWAESRKPKTALLETLTGSRKHKTWVARIVGKDATYKFAREFVNNFKHLGHCLEYSLTDGFYDVCNGGQRYYIRVVGGQIEDVEEYEITVA